MNAWRAACSSSGDASLVIPQGTYYLGPVKFTGPCPNLRTITVYQEVIDPHICIDNKKFLHPRIDLFLIMYFLFDVMQGVIKATTDLNKFTSGDDWVEFSSVNRLTLTGGGTFDGQGSSAWGNAQCPNNKYCKVLPVVCFKKLCIIFVTFFCLV